jgi:hypothetical protein
MWPAMERSFTWIIHNITAELTEPHIQDVLEIIRDVFGGEIKDV